MVLYLATKSAVDSVTRVLAKELGSRNIRVNSVNPGGTETEGAHALGVIGSDFQKQLIAQTPLGGFGQPEDIAHFAVFLASDASRWLTGEILHALRCWHLLLPDGGRAFFQMRWSQVGCLPRWAV
jgi:3-oxoacyl-[acyl-carrier protein] reductase